MSSLRVAAPRTFTDENAPLQHTVNKPTTSTRRGLGGASVNKPSSTPSSNPTKLSKPLTASTSRRALGDITNKSTARPSPLTVTKPSLAPVITSSLTSAAPSSVINPSSPLPLEQTFGLPFSSQPSPPPSPSLLPLSSIPSLLPLLTHHAHTMYNHPNDQLIISPSSPLSPHSPLNPHALDQLSHIDHLDLDLGF